MGRYISPFDDFGRRRSPQEIEDMKKQVLELTVTFVLLKQN